MKRITGYEYIDPGPEPVCCGFGGLFCVKFDTIAQGIAKTRLETFVEKGAETIVSNDPGCIMHLRKETERRSLSVKIIHLVEFLAAGMGLSTEFSEPL